MNRELMFLIVSAVFIVWFMGWSIWNLWLEDYLFDRELKKKKSDLTPYQQEKLEELMQYVHEELQRIDELRQQMDESNQGDDDQC